MKIRAKKCLTRNMQRKDKASKMDREKQRTKNSNIQVAYNASNYHTPMKQIETSNAHVHEKLCTTAYG